MGDHPDDGGWPFLDGGLPSWGWCLTILGIVGDHYLDMGDHFWKVGNHILDDG